MPYGVNDVMLENQNAGIRFYLPVNPTSIKWQGEVVYDRHETRAGWHYQFKKYRRTSGSMGVDTGAAQGLTVNGVNVGTGPLAAYKYMMELGKIVEKWMKGNVLENYGPLRLTDSTIPDYPIALDIIFTQWPEFGPDAQKLRYQINLNFEVLTDYQDSYDMSTIKTDVMPALGRAKTSTYKVKEGDTLQGVARKLYGDAELAPLISNILENQKIIGSGGKLKPGATLVIPYAPLPREYTSPTGQQRDGNINGTIPGSNGNLSGIIPNPVLPIPQSDFIP